MLKNIRNKLLKRHEDDTYVDEDESESESDEEIETFDMSRNDVSQDEEEHHDADPKNAAKPNRRKFFKSCLL
uniref:Uncharacterized protein n=1 Tax=Acrobeloides nanus TaxID=290746 RepID=A0A914EDP7_9BILA